VPRNMSEKDLKKKERKKNMLGSLLNTPMILKYFQDRQIEGAIN
jgi:hypothetical protein